MTAGRIVIGLAIIAFLCCSTDYEIPLSNGFFIARWQRGEFALVAPDRHTVVVQHLSGYRVDGNVVSGQAASDDNHAGYFIIDTGTRSVSTNLPEHEWKQRLNDLGIRNRELRPPKRPGRSVFDVFAH